MGADSSPKLDIVMLFAAPVWGLIPALADTR
jgi:hypothetical protein